MRSKFVRQTILGARKERIQLVGCVKVILPTTARIPRDVKRKWTARLKAMFKSNYPLKDTNHFKRSGRTMRKRA